MRFVGGGELLNCKQYFIIVKIFYFSQMTFDLIRKLYRLAQDGVDEWGMLNFLLTEF